MAIGTITLTNGYQYEVTGSESSWTPQSAPTNGNFTITDASDETADIGETITVTGTGITNESIVDDGTQTTTTVTNSKLSGWDNYNTIDGDVLVTKTVTTTITLNADGSVVDTPVVTTTNYLYSSNSDYYTSTTNPVTSEVTNTSTAQTIDNVSGTTETYTYCFLAGTRINTPIGLIPVEQLVIGDEVLTADGKTAKIRFNFKQVKTSHPFAGTKHYPIKISAGALADNIPSADLFVTPDHAIYFSALNIFAEASTLINGISIYQLTEMPASFTYYHLLCENQEIVLAENTPAETFIDNVTMAQFDNYAEYVALYPNHNEMIELDIPRAKSYRQLPRELKQDLLQRAELLYPSVKSKAA